MHCLNRCLHVWGKRGEIPEIPSAKIIQGQIHYTRKKKLCFFKLLFNFWVGRVQSQKNLNQTCRFGRFGPVILWWCELPLQKTKPTGTDLWAYYRMAPAIYPVALVCLHPSSLASQKSFGQAVLKMVSPKMLCDILLQVWILFSPVFKIRFYFPRNTSHPQPSFSNKFMSFA